MKRFLLIVFSMLLTATTSFAKEEAKPTTNLGPAEAKLETQLVEIKAKVAAIDREQRKVTLEGTEGNTMTIKVDEKVKNFKNIKKGDLVAVQYYESLAWSLRKHGEKAEPTKTIIQTTEVAKPGEKPAKQETEQVNLVATIEKIDKKTPAVTLKGPEGNMMIMKVKNPENLKGVKVGDQVDIAYTESTAISVEGAE